MKVASTVLKGESGENAVDVFHHSTIFNMSEKDLEKRNIAKEVKSRIVNGEPKQKILEELSQKYKDKAVNALVFVSLGLVILSFFIRLLPAVTLCPKIIEVPIIETETIKTTIYVFSD